jgi:CDP-diacylglycerol--glycerol-3-phosphate 3-phosphatidyltransferase
MSIFTWANFLSFFRIAVTPLFIFMMLSKDGSLIIWACFLFLVAAITDYFDGWLARKLKTESKFGRFFDPLADKFLTTAAFVVFVIMDIIPLWMVIIILIRDFGTTVLRVYGDKVQKPVKTSKFAKIKTFLQMGFIAYVLLLIMLLEIYTYVENIELINSILYSDFTVGIMFLITVLTVLSLLEYIFKRIFVKR